ncbi:MFS transporter [Chloroflexota bacterium]
MDKHATLSPDENKTPRFFYGYIIVIACFFIIMLVHGTPSAYGVFFNPIQAEFDWSRTTISGAQSLCQFLMGLFGILAGRLTDRFGPRIVVVAFGILLGLGLFLTSQVYAIWQLYLFYGMIVGIGSGTGDVALLSTTAKWFAKRRGMMSGIVKVGTGTGIMVTPLVASWLILSYGWRNAYIILGIITAVGIVSLAQLLKRDPAQKGLIPYGMYHDDANSSDLTNDKGISLREAAHTKQLWALCAIYFIYIYCALTFIVHIAPHAIDLGISVTHAASLVSIIGGASIIGRLVMGGASDRIGCKRAMVICFLFLIAALSWLQFAGELWALYLFVVLYGFSHGGFIALVSPMVADLFGTRSHGVILGVVLFFGQFGGAVGPLVAGRVFDVTSSYQLAFLILIIIGAIGFILVPLLRPIAGKVDVISQRG